MFFRKSLLTAVAGLGLAFASASGAHAAVITGYNFNLSAAGSGTFTGLGSATNVKLLDLAGGQAVIHQTVAGGSVFGQPFTEDGVIGITGYNHPTGGVVGLPLGTAADAFLKYSLTGFVDGSGFLHFTGGNAKLFLESDNDYDPTTGTVQTLANLNVVGGTSGSSLLPTGGLPSGSVGINFVIDTATSVAGLFTLGGNDLDGVALELANVQPVLDPTVVPNPDNSGVVGGNGTSVVVATGQGQIVLAVPEPGTVALFGAGLLGMGLVARRRRA